MTETRDDRERTRARSTLRSVAVPTEHGGWSLTLEPVLLGLLVAWSWSGMALGAAALVAFVARTPVKVVLVDRWRRRWLERTTVAARVAVIELLVLAALVAVALAGSEWSVLVPLAVAAPLVGLELWFDMRSRSRRLLPELAGTIGIGSVAAAIVLAAGQDADVAVGLWAVVAGRAVTSIPHVRLQLQRGKGHPVVAWHSDLAGVAGVAVVAVAWVMGAVPSAPVAALGLVAAVEVAALRMRPRRAAVIGIQQSVLGVLVVVVTALAM